MPVPRPKASPAMFVDTVTVRRIDPTDPAAKGRSGAFRRNPASVGTTYPAIVSPGQFGRADLNGTVEAVGAWRVLLLADADPVVNVDDSVDWTAAGSSDARSLVAEAQARPVGAGCWQVACSEVGDEG